MILSEPLQIGVITRASRIGGSGNLGLLISSYRDDIPWGYL
ncbi:3320_t:CDS:2 [Acaulospora morrowiae]|uniref:3320_t:CDS:1 n=1 Tax=Acaulospora morrowiae TaxID=94023 RepID=A0A9N9DBE6_9GLOM|nr:3320_t:CDS:2 [Acaulospora morrowiae]